MAKATLLTSPSSFSIQAKPRLHHTAHGVPRGGAVDRKTASTLNYLLDNPKHAPLLEWALIGPKIQFPEATFIAVSSFSKQTTLNGKALRPNEKTYVPVDSILHLGSNPDKVYSYLAIQDGFRIQKILGSKSTFKSLAKQDQSTDQFTLQYKGLPAETISRIRPSFTIPMLENNRLVRIIKAHHGPEYSALDKTHKHQLEQYFTLSPQRDRMGIQLHGLLPNSIPSMLSAPIIPGTIQLTPGGKLILLGNDCQTTGGYPRILWLPRKSLTTLYQLPSGIKFRFEISDYTS